VCGRVAGLPSLLYFIRHCHWTFLPLQTISPLAGCKKKLEDKHEKPGLPIIFNMARAMGVMAAEVIVTVIDKHQISIKGALS